MLCVDADGLQPLVTELDCLLSHTNRGSQGSPMLQQQQHLQAGAIQQLQQQRWDAQHSQQPARPASAAARLQGPLDGLRNPEGAWASGHNSSWQRTPGLGPLEQPPGRPGSAKAVHWGRYQSQQQHQPQAGRLQQGLSEAQARTRPPAPAQHQQQLCEEGDVLRHKPAASLLAASVMWQRSSEAAFRPPLRQCLTTAEIARQRNRALHDVEDG